MPGCCKKGVDGCPGKVPLTAKQCKGHRIYARVKSKMAAATGEGKENSWIRAVDNMKNLKASNCLKECCRLRWLPSQQVFIRSCLKLIFNSNFRLFL